MIYIAHGVVSDYFHYKFCHKYLLDLQKFENYLKNRLEKFVTLEEALNGKGDAFTIDDSTYASCDMAYLLKDYGHQVTIFINPYYIENKIDYWFLKVNYLLDNLFFKKITFQNKSYLLNRYQEKLLFRNSLKEAIAGLSTEEERQQVIEDIFKISMHDIDLPFYLKTITESEIFKLYQSGISIQNHGWTHRQLKNALEKDIEKEITLGKEWIKSKLEYDADFYAVPFGSTLPLNRFSNYNYCFLFEEQIAYGFKDERTYNRVGFKIE